MFVLLFAPRRCGFNLLKYENKKGKKKLNLNCSKRNDFRQKVNERFYLANLNWPFVFEMGAVMKRADWEHGIHVGSQQQQQDDQRLPGRIFFKCHVLFLLLQ